MVLVLNISKNNWITDHWWGSLTNARYTTFDVNGNQGTRYILLVMNKCVEVKWTIEFIHQETLMYSLSRWQGYLPLRHAWSQVPYLTLTSTPNDLLMSNISKNHRITDHWGRSLTNARYPTFDVNGNQGTRYILLVMNKFVDVELTIEFIHQETLMYFLSRWQGYLPLRHAGS